MNAFCRAIPVTIPGRAMGSTTRKLTLDRPKNLYRATANAAIVPSTRAIAVAPSPALTEFSRPSIAPLLCAARPHHFNV